MNNPLTPTPRVDKNGRVVTRHMKQGADSTAKQALPTVGALTQQAKDLNYLVDRVMEDEIVTADRGEVTKALKSILKKRRKVEGVEELKELLTSGSEASKSYAHKELIREVKLYINPRIDKVSLKPFLDKILPHCTGINVVNEVGGKYKTVGGKPNDATDNVLYFATSYNSFSECQSHNMNVNEIEYWRGATALAIYETELEEEVFFDNQPLIDQSARFIEFAGTHPDIKRVVEVAIGMKSRNPDLIKQAMDGTISDSLSSGIL